MAKKSEKTNALRLLDKLKIPYEAHSYPCEEFTGGEDVARQLGLDPADVCKTLVTVGKSGGHFVFVLPVTGELDRKKAAALVGEKSLEMLHVKDLLAVTGYVRGGCTALGMKKQYPTVVELMARFRVPASTIRAYSPRRRVFFRWLSPTRTMVRFSPKSFITSATVPTAARSA